MAITQADLGASMYVPTTHKPDTLVDIGNGVKYPQLRSVIFCTEDAVREDQLHEALRNLGDAAVCLNDNERPLRFIRVRNPHVLGLCLSMRGIEKFDGFVLPKLTASNLGNYLAQINAKSPFLLMPTLETAEVFDYSEMNKLRRMLQEDPRAAGRILCLRIGGNDLLNCLRIRRDPRRTIYDTPVGDLISRLAGEFIPHGFGLTAPVFESIENPDVLAEEVAIDLNNGLFGKTAIHPTQIALIERGFQVSASDLAEAHKILEPDAPAVFRMGGRMCEPTTHSKWAHDIVARSLIYGVRQSVELAA
jgi:citrate lyase beta subunit